MNTAVYLALRTIRRDKKRSALLIATITIVLMATIAVSILQTNALSLEAVNAEINHGRWHLAYIAANTEAIDALEDLPTVESATLGYRLKPIAFDDDDFNLDLTLFQEGKFSAFTRPLVVGGLPQGAREIIVDDWALRRYEIDSLPAEITLGEYEFTITGAYKSRISLIDRKVVTAFGLVEPNTELLSEQMFSGSPGRIASSVVFDAGPDPSFVYLRLNPGVEAPEAAGMIDDNEALALFPATNSFRDPESSGPAYNQALLQAEGRSGVPNRGLNPSRLAMMVRLLLWGTLFAMVYVTMNVVINNATATLGLYTALGITPHDLRKLVILQAVFCALFAIPLGVTLGVSSIFFLEGSMGAYLGSIVVPWTEVLGNIVVSVVAIAVGAFKPAVRASTFSPLAALNSQAGVDVGTTNVPPWLKLGAIRGKGIFSVLYGLKHAFKHYFRLAGFAIVITALLALFTLVTSDIERQWKVGAQRLPHQPDYVISLPYIHYGNNGPHYDSTVRPVDDEFKNRLSQIAAIDKIYYQHGVVWSLFLYGAAEGGLLHYEWRFPDAVLTEQGRRTLALSGPLYRSESPGEAFVMGNVAGYGQQELEFAKDYLLEGAIDIVEMAAEPIVLLPKHILTVENVDIPYTNLQVGDEITLVENRLESIASPTPVREYVFTIGGFVDPVPLPQPGSSTGFIGIMHNEQLARLQTSCKGILEIFVDEEADQVAYRELNALTREYRYDLRSNYGSFRQMEAQTEGKQAALSLYVTFSVLGLILFIAIYSMLSAEIIVRKPEFAMLAALGMTRGQILAAVLTQALLPGVIASPLGIAGGIVLVSRFYKGGSEILSVADLIPWQHLLVGVFLVIGACLLAALISFNSTFRNTSVQDVKRH